MTSLTSLTFSYRRLLAFSLATLFSGACATAPPGPTRTTPVSPPFKSFAIYSSREPRKSHYVPSGYMGDVNDLKLSGDYRTSTPLGGNVAIRVTYQPKGKENWVGIFWQDPANNWGNIPGPTGYDLRGAARLTFWARGEHGGEWVKEFRMGGIVGNYPDSDTSAIGPVRLTKEWKKHTIPLKGKDLRHIIGGFGFFLTRAEDPLGCTFYLADLFYEGEEGQEGPLGKRPEVPTEQASPAPPVPEAAPPPVRPPPVSENLQVRETEEGLRVSFSSKLLFTPGKADLLPESYPILDEFITLLNAYPKNLALVEGHTDSKGPADFNLRLSELRAQSVMDHLMKRGGYPRDRFILRGYGATKPIATNETAAGRALNRRVEITILKQPVSKP